ncbi:putative Enoyl CoA hydratase isomerase [Trypanosoma vivax]|uniref:Putative enoyl-CoA hydratase, mitochondrial n=1 Tax=Trypanosoma vivax (strain Y486) TaxID=1055687 RepID=G0TTG7_TRYVY|nr:putative enoyl-CoA hydratase, precursor [Trypanosoma vivax]KAH8605481.1 putative Enoyl CoA hydratase isomerase [Trypanosoma vivax]CCC47248.1 putative enoyl-CoA hydratase, mitochondrial precursor [Trypanosoma vivax Y486]
MLRACRVLQCVAEPLVKCTRKGSVVTLTLNRPKQLNALNKDLIDCLAENVLKCDADPQLSVMIITGEGRAFVAGADIKSMADQNLVEFHRSSMISGMEALCRAKKPIIAAVNGFALGGGCELVMCCDIAVASERAIFGQSEIKIGTIPGIGGTQRLTRLIGKSRAMEWILTGDQYSAEEALRAGLVSRVVKHDELLPSALSIAEKIAINSPLIVSFAKDCVNRAFETTLAEGIAYERRVFEATFATHDKKEGMNAFLEKRKPVFRNM